MTPDPQLLALVDVVRQKLPDWTPPVLPNGDASALLDRLAAARLRDVLTFASSWPDGVRQQTVDAIERVIRALETGNDRHTAYAAACSAAARLVAPPDEAASAVRAALGAGWSEHSAAVSAHRVAWSAAYSAPYAFSATLGAAWQREADRITTAIEEQS